MVSSFTRLICVSKYLHFPVCVLIECRPKAMIVNAHDQSHDRLSNVRGTSVELPHIPSSSIFPSIPNSGEPSLLS